MPGDGARDGIRGELIADRYQLLARLGRGGMGEVWSGRDLRLHRDVAVKLFRSDVATPVGLPDWLRREGIAAAQINHPNVAVLYDQGAHKGRIYLVMELVAGATLDDVMRSGPLPAADAVRFASQISDALAAAHAAQVVHRDIKPQNVLITPDGSVKVVDFGIAGFLSDTRSWTIARFEEAVKGTGTPEYAAPEQVTGHKADARSDLYSLGTVLYAMLAGRVPFVAESYLTVMHRKVTENPPSLAQARPGLPVALLGLVESLLAREPADRPRSAREVAEHLRAIAAGLVAPGPPPQERATPNPAPSARPEADPPLVPRALSPATPQPRPKVEGSGQAGDKTPWTPEPEPQPAPAPDTGPQPTAPKAPVPGPIPVEASAPSSPPVKPAVKVEVSQQPPPARPPQPATPQPDAMAATGATKLSAVAQVELRGRSLLPPPGGSPTGADPQAGPQHPNAPSHDERRHQVLTRVLLATLLIAVVVAVALAATLK